MIYFLFKLRDREQTHTTHAIVNSHTLQRAGRPTPVLTWEVILFCGQDDLITLLAFLILEKQKRVKCTKSILKTIRSRYAVSGRLPRSEHKKSTHGNNVLGDPTTFSFTTAFGEGICVPLETCGQPPRCVHDGRGAQIGPGLFYLEH